MSECNGLPCPECKGLLTRVIDSRPLEDFIRRRRECKECGLRFSTCEIVYEFARGRRSHGRRGIPDPSQKAIDSFIDRVLTAS